MNQIKTILLIYFFISCQGPTSNYKPKSSGNINTVTVVIENTLWKGSVGEKIRESFASEFFGLPQQEPVFSLKQIPPGTFSGFTRESRNILLIQKREKDTFFLEKNKYAYPQVFVSISKKNNKQLIQTVNKNKNKIISEIKKNEIKEKQKRIRISSLKKTNLRDLLSIDLRMPSVYKIYKQGKRMAWFQRDTDKGTVNVLAYELNEDATKDHNLKEIIKIRDSIGKLFIPGRNEDSHMITEEAYEPYFKKLKINGLESIETRGTWEVKNDFMAGPFVNYTIKDTINNRIIVLEGFVFSPSSKKRNLIFELEAIFRSVKIY
jgi:hypothetical protein